MIIVRIAFFATAFDNWDQEIGKFKHFHNLFHFLDECSKSCFLTTLSLVALFWAEVYYVAIDRIHIYSNAVAPVVIIFNLFAYAGIFYCTFFVPLSWQSDAYVYEQFAVGLAIAYILCACLVFYFTMAAAAEINQVPVPLATRKSRTNHLYIIAFICPTALILNAAFCISLRNKALSTRPGEPVFLLSMCVYYVLLELLPLLVVALFYSNRQPCSLSRSVIMRIASTEDSLFGHREDLEDEGSPFVNSTGYRWSQDAGKLRGYGADHPASDDLVEEIIAKLSQ